MSLRGQQKLPAAISGRQKKLANARQFDLLHNSHLTVPMYAYRCELFVSSSLLPSFRGQENPKTANTSLAIWGSFLFKIEKSFGFSKNEHRKAACFARCLPYCATRPSRVSIYTSGASCLSLASSCPLSRGVRNDDRQIAN